MTDLEKDKILLLAHSIEKMARELQSIKRLLKEIADTPQTERSACDTCQWHNSGIPCGVEPSVCKREVADTPQTEQTDCAWK